MGVLPDADPGVSWLWSMSQQSRQPREAEEQPHPYIQRDLCEAPGQRVITKDSYLCAVHRQRAKCLTLAETPRRQQLHGQDRPRSQKDNRNAGPHQCACTLLIF
jgi:hypothetical protein